MVKNVLLVLSAGLCFTANAQREAGSNQHFRALEFSSDRAIDTIQSPALVVYGATLYNSSGSGWVTGTNNYGDLAKAQKLNAPGTVTVIGMGAWILGYEFTSGDNNSAFSFNINPANGTGTASTGAVNDAPGTALATTPVLMTDVDTSLTGSYGMTWAAISPTEVSGDFYASVNLSTLATGDAIGIISTRDSVTGPVDVAWEQFTDGSWFSISHPTSSWGLDIAMYVFVVIDDGATAIEEAATMNGMRLAFLNGNMINDQVTVQFDLDNTARTTLVISDAAGRIVVNQDLGVRSAGYNLETIDASAWNAGTYFVSLISNGKNITKQVMKN